MESLSAKKKILIIGDSLCLPRERPEKVEFNEVWPRLLLQTGKFEIVQIALGGGTIKHLHEQASYYKSFNPDIVILQSGVVDCAPRALRRVEVEMITSSRLLSIIFRIFPAKAVRKIRNITYVNEKSFEAHLRLITKMYCDSFFICIGILPAVIDYENKIPNISNNIKKYNNILESESDFGKYHYVNTSSIPEDAVMSDYHHLNIIGHKWLFDKLIAIINT